MPAEAPRDEGASRSLTPPPGRPPPSDGDGWVHCRCGQRHWGRFGAAGLLLADDEGQVVLQHRAPWSHHGGTWGVPGGARNEGETAVQAAVREAGEEAGVRPPVDPHATHVLDHPDWSYTTVLAHAPTGLPVQATDAESVQVRWFPAHRLPELPLLPAFEKAWPLLEEMLATRAVLVVDAANVVGARPDGWWQDRAGATTRLAHRLAVLSRNGVGAELLGLPGDTWWPDVVLVTEGQGRAVADMPGLRTVRAQGDGDEAVMAAVTGADEFITHPATATNVQVHVASADRELRSRAAGAGAGLIGPGALWRVLDSQPR